MKHLNLTMIVIMLILCVSIGISADVAFNMHWLPVSLGVLMVMLFGCLLAFNEELVDEFGDYKNDPQQLREVRYTTFTFIGAIMFVGALMMITLIDY